MVKKLKRLIPVMGMIYGSTLLILVAVGLYAFNTGQHVWFFTVEPFLLGNLPSYAGILATAGNLLWGSSAAVCFFSAWVLKAEGKKRAWKNYFRLFGLLTVLLLTDGLFQMHRIFYPEYLHIPMAVVFAFYGIFAAGLLVKFRHHIRETDFLLLALALIFFFLSVVFDMISILPRGNTAFSDGLKLFGIVSWLVYLLRTGRQILTGFV
jgi:hypothetical protein